MQALSIDPYHYMNIYSANLWAMGAEGWSYLPNQWAAGSHLQSVNLDYRRVNPVWGWMLTHEVGHHLGLDHTFSGNCSNPNDGIDDTPQHHQDGLWSCNSGQDTCPNDPGNDPIYNYMNYTSCTDHFTPGQRERMHAIVATYHPSLLENQAYYPVLTLDGLTYLQDTDGDNQFNPGDTTRVKVVLSNEWGGDAVNIEATLTSQDDRVTILDNHNDFNLSLIHI